MQIVARASVVFVFLLLVLRTMGRKELARLSPFELILLIVMGDLIQQGVTQQDNSLTGAMAAVGTLTLWMLAMSYLSFKSRRLGRLFEGSPVIIVSEGKPIERMLHLERLTLDEVKSAAREQGIADLAQIRVGILESGGAFSFIRYDDRAHPKPQQSDVD